MTDPLQELARRLDVLERAAEPTGLCATCGNDLCHVRGSGHCSRCTDWRPRCVEPGCGGGVPSTTAKPSPRIYYCRACGAAGTSEQYRFGGGRHSGCTFAGKWVLDEPESAAPVTTAEEADAADDAEDTAGAVQGLVEENRRLRGEVTRLKTAAAQVDAARVAQIQALAETRARCAELEASGVASCEDCNNTRAALAADFAAELGVGAQTDLEAHACAIVAALAETRARCAELESSNARWDAELASMRAKGSA